MQQTESQMRELVSQLRPGDQVVVDHEVKVGQTRWHAVTSGEVVRTDRRRHSLHFDRNFDDRVWSDMILLRRPDGELTTVAIDEFTRVRRQSDADDASPTDPPAADGSAADRPIDGEPSPASS